MKFPYKTILVLLITIQFSCSKSKDDIDPIGSSPIEEIVLLEFNSTFTPANNNLEQALLPIPTLTWSLKNTMANETISFEVKLGIEATDLKVLNSSVADNSYQIETLLEPETTYFWQVSFTNRDGTKTSSDIQQFTTLSIAFKDAALEQIIRDVLSKPSGDFTKEDLSSILSIPIEHIDGDYAALLPYDLINDLSGLEYCHTIERVNLMQRSFRSPITDLSPLKNLKSITYLNVADNSVSDLSPLAELTDLQYLHLGWNTGISDLSPLNNLKKLKDLNLTYTHGLRDITPLENLTQLDSLTYDHAYYITDITPIGTLVNLKHLRFTGSELIDDFAFLDQLTQLEALYLERNILLTDISFMENMEQLIKLDLRATGVTDISILANHTDMEFLGLGGLAISDFSILNNMPNLKELHFDDYVIDDNILSKQEILDMFPGVRMRINSGAFFINP